MTAPVDPDSVALIMAVLDAYARDEVPERHDVRAAVKASLALLSDKAPGHSVEVRIPPFAAIQVVDGIRHRRGTPPAVVECDPRTWLELAAGELTWQQVTADGRLRASGERSDLSALLPLHPRI